MVEIGLQQRSYHSKSLHHTRGKILKTCVSCRLKKIKCNAYENRPSPCSYCSKRRLECTLGVITNLPERPNDIVSKLGAEVDALKVILDKMIDRKTALINMVLKSFRKTNVGKAVVPPVSKLQSYINSPVLTPVPLTPQSPMSDKLFVISSERDISAFSIAQDEALVLFENFEESFNKYIPVFPEYFFKKLDVSELYEKHDLLFWTIISTSLLQSESVHKYLFLSKHIMALTVEKCWLNTPRSIYTLCALLILTTWPIQTQKARVDNSELSLKYLSLMRNISLQLGLHRSELINEFSHKTEMKFTDDFSKNNIIRNRIYKLICVNTNYWSVYLGLPNGDYDGWNQDYIINNAVKNLKAYKNGEESYIDSILRISLIQLKSSENMRDLLLNRTNEEGSFNTEKQINIFMFNNILNDLKCKLLASSDSRLLEASIEYSKLQLYVYGISPSDVTLTEYKQNILEALECCKRIVDLVSEEFKDSQNFCSIPIHFRFMIELVSLFLLRVHSLPILPSKEHYIDTKRYFKQSYDLMSKNNNTEWLSIHSSHFKLVRRYDQVCKTNYKEIVNQEGFFLMNNMSKFLVSGLKYEIMLIIFQADNNSRDESLDASIDWKKYGMKYNSEVDRKIIDYLTENCSIFS